MMERTFCAICGAATEVGVITCSRCLSDQPVAAEAPPQATQATSALIASGVAESGGWWRYGSRLLLLGGDVVAGLVLVLLIFGLIQSAGQHSTAPGSTSPQFVAPIIVYPTPSQIASTPSVAPRAPTSTPSAAAHQPASGSSPVATPTPTPSPTAPPPTLTPTPIPPTPMPTQTVGQFQ